MNTTNAINPTSPTNPMNAVGDMLRARVVLAPMAGVTDVPFRLTARRYGCRFAFTEMIDVNGIVYRNAKSFDLMERPSDDSPLGVQIVGQDEERLLYVARMCEEKGFGVVDINAGCPARKVIKGGKGSALLKDPDKLARIVARISSEISIPVTVKMRIGWDGESMNYLDVATAAATAGADALCVHSRTTEQMYKGEADHKVVREIKGAVDIPVFASGNIFSADDAVSVIEDTGCDGVFVARGAMGRPWIFRDIYSRLDGVETPQAPSFDEIKAIMSDHFMLAVQYDGPRLAARKMYKHITWYLKKLKGLHEVMKEYGKVDGPGTFRDFLDRLRLEDNRRLVLG